MTKAPSNIWVRTADLTDAAAIAAIYNHYVKTSTVTFEEIEVHAEEMSRRIRDVRAKHLPWYLALNNDITVGYAYATPWRSRSAYRFSVEVTVYVVQGLKGRGIGTRLFTALLDTLQKQSFHTAIGVIALPNPESVALHERLGFRKVGHFTQVGFKMGRWVDVGYWQRNLHPDDRQQPD